MEVIERQRASARGEERGPFGAEVYGERRAFREAAQSFERLQAVAPRPGEVGRRVAGMLAVFEQNFGHVKNVPLRGERGAEGKVFAREIIKPDRRGGAPAEEPGRFVVERIPAPVGQYRAGIRRALRNAAARGQPCGEKIPVDDIAKGPAVEIQMRVAGINRGRVRRAGERIYRVREESGPQPVVIIELEEQLPPARARGEAPVGRAVGGKRRRLDESQARILKTIDDTLRERPRRIIRDDDFQRAGESVA